MRAMRAEQFSGYEARRSSKTSGLGRKVLLRMTAIGVRPLEHTLLSGQFPLAKTPLVLGGEGAGVVEERGGTDSCRFTCDVHWAVWRL
jgi:NADPH2:quinone reductase